MDIKEVDKIKSITTFTELNSLFNEWIADGKAEENKGLFLLGYTSLISYPAIILTKNLANTEVSAAQKCYELVMKYSKDSIKRMMESDDAKNKAAADILMIPSDKRLLAGCTQFYMLDHLLNAQTTEMSDEALAMIDGTDYAKQWHFIFNLGYQGEQSANAIMEDHDYRVKSARRIAKMKLTDEYRQKMDLESYLSEDKMNRYLHMNNKNESGAGCVLIFLVLGALTLLASCI